MAMRTGRATATGTATSTDRYAGPWSAAGGGSLGYGVIGSPADSGSASLGSSPGTPARSLWSAFQISLQPPSSSGLGRRPLKAVAAVRIRSGVLLLPP